jgi:hypothetical protein
MSQFLLFVIAVLLILLDKHKEFPRACSFAASSHSSIQRSSARFDLLATSTKRKSG